MPRSFFVTGTDTGVGKTFAYLVPLLLSGKRELAKEQTSQRGYYTERSCGSFSRSFTLGDGVDPEKIEASYKNGVLTVKLPKKEAIKPRQIPVSTN